ncbi:hypothetical protein ACSYDW_03340 [Paeniglutamicibacter sp. R2-26]|uniref:hypothetical protein n=1 Tax=Paeniglutamicibacter sp. R2-26 TaxID=3144417 RepID=UPI003EE7DD8B
MLKIGRHRGEAFRPDNNDSGPFERALLAFLSWWYRNLFEPIWDYFSDAADRVQGSRRSRRWLICGALGILALVLGGLIVAATAEGNKRDFVIITTQAAEEGVLVEEDYAACRMEIDLHGQRVGAETSCNTGSSFPTGTKVSVVLDPEDSGRLLVVSPGQDWHEANSDDIWFGIVASSVVALLVVWVGYLILLQPDRPESPLGQQAADPADGLAATYQATVVSAAVDRFGESWESRKEAAGKGWINFVDMDVRIRGTILGALVIVVTGAIMVLGAGMHADLVHDRTLAKTQPIVNTTLIDFGDKGMNPVVRFGTQAVELDHGLRWEVFRNIGETVPVVEDPAFTERLIPAELADSRGLWGMVLDNAPMIFLWSAVVGFLGWMLIPRELAAVGKAFDMFLRRGRPKPRH